MVREIQKVAIIGARGQMGGLFTERCEAVGVEVAGVNRPLTREKLAVALDGADVLYLSVPAPAVAGVLELCEGLMAPGTILADNVSVKVAPLKSMLDLYDGPVVGTHPLFGPNPPEDARVVLTPGRDDEALAAVEAWTRKLGFDAFVCTAEEHDKYLGVIQGLNFVTTVAYLATLSHDEDIRKFLTPSFQRRLDAAKKMLTEDAELFSTLFETNPFGQDAVRRYRSFLNVAAGGDIDILVQRALWWWRDSE